MSDEERSQSELVERLAEAATSAELTIAVAESLTGGQLAAALAAGPDASTWLLGGVVAYNPEVKFRLLGVSRGPVVTRSCAEQMAQGVARLTDARISVAVTGVGGPDPEEGEPAGTVWLALCVDGNSRGQRFEFDGEPADVLAATVRRSLAVLVDTAEGMARPSGTDGAAPPPPGPSGVGR